VLDGLGHMLHCDLESVRIFGQLPAVVSGGGEAKAPYRMASMQVLSLVVWLGGRGTGSGGGRFWVRHARTPCTRRSFVCMPFFGVFVGRCAGLAWWLFEGCCRDDGPSLVLLITLVMAEACDLSLLSVYMWGGL